MAEEIIVRARVTAPELRLSRRATTPTGAVYLSRRVAEREGEFGAARPLSYHKLKLNAEAVGNTL